MNFLFSLANFQLFSIIVFGGFFLGGYYFAFYDDGSALEKAISDVQTQTRQVEGDISKTQKEIENVKIFEREIKTQQKAVRYFLNYIPNSLTFTEIYTLVLQTAKSSGVNIEVKKDQQTEVQETEDTEYHALTVELKISGAFSQIVLFLSQLTTQKRILIVNNIDMRVERPSPLITADIELMAYRLQSSLSEKK